MELPIQKASLSLMKSICTCIRASSSPVLPRNFPKHSVYCFYTFTTGVDGYRYCYWQKQGDAYDSCVRCSRGMPQYIWYRLQSDVRRDHGCAQAQTRDSRTLRQGKNTEAAKAIVDKLEAKTPADQIELIQLRAIINRIEIIGK